MTKEAAIMLASAEVDRATNLHGPFASAHEGYGVIMEEFREFEEAMRGKDPVHLQEEVVQCAAMFLRFLIDCR